MADGKWVMTEEDAKRVDLSFDRPGPPDLRSLPNYGDRLRVDDPDGGAAMRCAFCGSGDILTGFGGSGEGFSYRSCKCRACGGTTEYVRRTV